MKKWRNIQVFAKMPNSAYFFTKYPMPSPAPYISANTSITNELRRELTNPAMMEGLAAGRITLVIRLKPVSSKVAALSN